MSHDWAVSRYGILDCMCASLDYNLLYENDALVIWRHLKGVAMSWVVVVVGEMLARLWRLENVGLSEATFSVQESGQLATRYLEMGNFHCKYYFV